MKKFVGWYDGTHGIDITEYNKMYPKKIIEGFQTDRQGKEAIIIIDREVVLSDPRYFCLQLFDEGGNCLDFYVPFFNNEVYKIAKFIKNRGLNNTENVRKEDNEFLFVLISKEKDGSYRNLGEFIYVNAFEKETLDILSNDKNNSVFYLPLHRKLYECPCCGAKDLFDLMPYTICSKCGWEIPDLDFYYDGCAHFLTEYRKDYFEDREKKLRKKYPHLGKK